MFEKSNEVVFLGEGWRQLPILERIDGKIPNKLVININGLLNRISGDIQNSRIYFENIDKNTIPLDTCLNSSTSENELLINTKIIIENSINGQLPTDENLKTLAGYLAWSFQEQTKELITNFDKKSAAQYGLSAFEVWVLYTSIKNRFEK